MSNQIVRKSERSTWRVAGLALGAVLLVGASARADGDFENAFEASLGHFLAFEAVQAAKAALFYGAPVAVAVPYVEPAYYPVAVPVPVAVGYAGYAVPVHYSGHRHHNHYQPRHHGHHRHDRHCGHAGWDRGRGHGQHSQHGYRGGHANRGDHRGHGYSHRDRDDDDRGRGRGRDHGGKPGRGHGRGDDGRHDGGRYANR